MKNKWLTGLSLASVAGTGGAAFVGVFQPPSAAHPAVQVPPAAGENSTTTSGSPSSIGRSVTYQVGDAGAVTLAATTDSIAIQSVVPKPEWTVVAAVAQGGHANVQFADTRRIVAINVDLVGGEMVVSATNDLVPGSADTTPTAPVDTPLVTTSPAPVVLVASPPPGGSADGEATISTTAEVPSRSATTATSAAGGGGATSEHGDDHGGTRGGESDD